MLEIDTTEQRVPVLTVEELIYRDIIPKARHWWFSPSQCARMGVIPSEFSKEVTSMGGKPNPGTKPDKRLKDNKAGATKTKATKPAFLTKKK